MKSEYGGRSNLFYHHNFFNSFILFIFVTHNLSTNFTQKIFLERRFCCCKKKKKIKLNGIRSNVVDVLVFVVFYIIPFPLFLPLLCMHTLLCFVRVGVGILFFTFYRFTSWCKFPKVYFCLSTVAAISVVCWTEIIPLHSSHTLACTHTFFLF